MTVHVEVAVGCSTMVFLQVLSRIVFQYEGDGGCNDGLQFVHAEKELCEMVPGLNQGQIKEICTEHGIH